MIQRVCTNQASHSVFGMDKNKKPAVVFSLKKIVPADVSLCHSHINLMATAITKVCSGRSLLQHWNIYIKHTQVEKGMNHFFYHEFLTGLTFSALHRRIFLPKSILITITIGATIYTQIPSIHRTFERARYEKTPGKIM